MRRAIAILCWLYLGLLIAFWLILRVAGARWWLATLMLFGPGWVSIRPPGRWLPPGAHSAVAGRDRNRCATDVTEACPGERRDGMTAVAALRGLDVGYRLGDSAALVVLDMAAVAILWRSLEAGLAVAGLAAHDTVVAGPGLGADGGAGQLVSRALAVAMPVVLDADALNLIASHPPLCAALQGRAGVSVLTPHPTEAARLLHTDTATIQGDRLAAARRANDRNPACAPRRCVRLHGTPCRTLRCERGNGRSVRASFAWAELVAQCSRDDLSAEIVQNVGAAGRRWRPAAS